MRQNETGTGKRMNVRQAGRKKVMNKDGLKYNLALRDFGMYESVRAVNAIFEIISETLSKGEKVKINGFGTFRVIKREARNLVNPRTREPVPVESFRYVSFRAGIPLKKRVRQYQNTDART